MRRSTAGGFLLVAAAALAAFALKGAADERRLAFTLGVAPGLVAVELEPGKQACQSPVVVAESFAGVRMLIGTFHRAGQPLDVMVRGGSRRLAAGRLHAGYPDGARPVVSLDRPVPEGRSVRVCVRNLGSRRVALFGNSAAGKTRSTASLDGEPVPFDLTLDFFRAESRSGLAVVPDMFRRAAVFSAGWVGPWTFWLLAAATFLCVPLLLGASLVSAARECECSQEGEDSR